MSDDLTNGLFEHTDGDGDRLSVQHFDDRLVVTADSPSSVVQVVMNPRQVAAFHTVLGMWLRDQAPISQNVTPSAWDDVATDIKAMRVTLEEGMRLLTRAEVMAELSDEDPVYGNAPRCNAPHPVHGGVFCHLAKEHLSSHHESSRNVWAA